VLNINVIRVYPYPKKYRKSIKRLPRFCQKNHTKMWR
jgi:hypothetical protein